MLRQIHWSYIPYNILFANGAMRFWIFFLILNFGNGIKSHATTLDLFNTTQTEQNPAFEEGLVTGRVTDDNNQPLPNVSISILNTNFGGVTNELGEFSIKVEAGKYVLQASFIGYKTVQNDISIVEGQTTNIEIQLRPDALTLTEFVVQENVVNRFGNKNSDYIARLPLANIENPQVYSVVTGALLEEQVLVDVEQSLRNAVGTIPIIYPSGGLAAFIRGFNVGVNARNGMETTSGRSSVDIANLERIEVLKGPSATLFGSSVSSFGGVVNLVTKVPHDQRQTAISYTMGGYNLHRLTADINTPLNQEKTALFRLNAGLNRAKSFKDYGHNNSFIIAPSLLYKVTNRITFLFDAEFYNVNSTRTNYSRYATNSGITSPEDFGVEYNKAFYHDDANSQTAGTKLFAKIEVDLARNWKSTSLLSFVGEDVDHSYQYYPTWLSPTEVARSIGNWGPIYNNYTNFQQNFNGKISTGAISHSILIGGNFRFVDGRAEASTAGFIDTINVLNPFKVLRKKDLDPHMISGNWPGWHKTNNITYSAYIMDVVSLTDRLSALLSLRLDHFDRPQNGVVEGLHQTAFAPKFGIVYQLIRDQISLFSNYQSGFQNLSPTTQPDGRVLVLDPLYASQLEGGIKVEAIDKRWNATLSYYNIDISNDVRTGSDGYIIQDGEKLSQGIDIELITNPISGLNFLLGYGYNDSRYIKVSDESIKGNKVEGVPSHVANFWVSYKLQSWIKGLGVGFGGNYVDHNYQFSNNIFTIPAYTVLNTTIFYDHSTWRLGLKLNNLTNEEYWSTYVVAQDPINFAINMTLKF